ncbi:MAG: hypothetical protein ACI81R_000308 [Bradymonadia bacterium]|jgi:hypothetical protein
MPENLIGRVSLPVPVDVPLRARYAAYEIAARLVSEIGETDAPLVVLGTGRCGSTLTVRVLQSHPDIEDVPGELNTVLHPATYPYRRRSIEVPPFVVNPRLHTELSLAAWPESNDVRLRRVIRGFRITEGLGYPKTLIKTAMGAFLLPTLLRVWPNLRVVHLVRHGFPVCESFVVKEWHKYEHVMANQAEYRLHAARYWRDCVAELERVNVQYGLSEKGRYVTVRYEDLCDDPKGQLARIGDVAGLDPERFGYDMSKISSRNHKHDVDSELGQQMLEIMDEQLRAFGYV